MLIKFAIDYRNNKLTQIKAEKEQDILDQKSELQLQLEARQSQISEYETIRMNLIKEHNDLRDELRKDIVGLRQHLIQLQDANVKYAVENAEFKTLIRLLESELKEFKAESRAVANTAVVNAATVAASAANTAATHVINTAAIAAAVKDLTVTPKE